MPVFEQLVLPAILQCQHHSGSPPSAQMLLCSTEACVQCLQNTFAEELALGLGPQWSVHISDNQSISNETPWTSLAAVRNTGPQGRKSGGYSLKRPLLRQEPNCYWLSLVCLITKWAFLKRQAVSSGSCACHLLHMSLVSAVPKVSGQPPLCLISTAYWSRDELAGRSVC